jgi:hypothetical protein
VSFAVITLYVASQRVFVVVVVVSLSSQSGNFWIHPRILQFLLLLSCQMFMSQEINSLQRFPLDVREVNLFDRAAKGRMMQPVAWHA